MLIADDCSRICPPVVAMSIHAALSCASTVRNRTLSDTSYGTGNSGSVGSEGGAPTSIGASAGDGTAAVLPQQQPEAVSTLPHPWWRFGVRDALSARRDVLLFCRYRGLQIF